MDEADLIVGPLMNTILSCLCEQAARAPNPPAICCFRVGVEIPHDAGINEDQCCEGIGYVALGDTYPSAVSFPEQDIIRQADAKCTFPPGLKCSSSDSFAVFRWGRSTTPLAAMNGTRQLFRMSMTQQH
jgi:hypothetical protein